MAQKWKWLVREKAQERGLTSPIQLAKAAGIATNTAVSYWYSRPRLVDLGVLEKLAKAVGISLPMALLEYNPEGEEDTEGAIEAPSEDATPIAPAVPFDNAA